MYISLVAMEAQATCQLLGNLLAVRLGARKGSQERWRRPNTQRQIEKWKLFIQVVVSVTKEDKNKQTKSKEY